jgi:hypothetical protein
MDKYRRLRLLRNISAVVTALFGIAFVVGMIGSTSVANKDTDWHGINLPDFYFGSVMAGITGLMAIGMVCALTTMDLNDKVFKDQIRDSFPDRDIHSCGRQQYPYYSWVKFRVGSDRIEEFSVEWDARDQRWKKL